MKCWWHLAGRFGGGPGTNGPGSCLDLSSGSQYQPRANKHKVHLVPSHLTLQTCYPVSFVLPHRSEGQTLRCRAWGQRVGLFQPREEMGKQISDLESAFRKGRGSVYVQDDRGRAGEGWGEETGKRRRNAAQV